MKEKNNEPVWKYSKYRKDGKCVQDEIKLKDATLSQLIDWQDICESMLNGNDKHVGKIKRLEFIDNISIKVYHEYMLRIEMSNSQKTKPNILDEFIKKESYLNMCENIIDKYMVKACTNRLGVLTEKSIPVKVIFNMGINIDNSFSSIEDVKEYLGFNKNTDMIFFRGDGLNPLDVKLILMSYGKEYNDIPTNAIKCLYEKIIPTYKYKLKKEIQKWEEIKNNISEEINRR